MSSHVKPYIARRNGRDRIFKSISYVNNNNDTFECFGKSYDDYDDCQNAIARVALRECGALTMPDEETDTPDHLG